LRGRWFNHLNPDIKKLPWTDEEDRIVIQWHQQIGNKWAEIAKRLPGRSVLMWALLDAISYAAMLNVLPFRLPEPTMRSRTGGILLYNASLTLKMSSRMKTRSQRF